MGGPLTDGGIKALEGLITNQINSLQKHIDQRLGEHERWLGENTRAIEKLAEGSVREDRFKSGMYKVEKLEQRVNELDDKTDELVVSRATMQQTIDSYKKFVWLMIGSTVTLFFTLVAGVILWLVTG
jgi:tetrahydromethanopterin S-methyltransferase subunit B